MNHYSQWDEDEILAEIFSKIGTSSKACIEVGANDGLSCSNTARLWRHEGWSALLIEKDKDLFVKIMENTKDYKVRGVLQGVGEMNGLDTIVKHIHEHYKEDFTQPDLISIDVDGSDFAIVQETQLRPRVFVVEFNPSFPEHISYVQKNRDDRIGCSLLSLAMLMQSKNYFVYATTEANIIAVRGDLTSSNLVPRLETPWKKHLCQAIYDYDGNLAILGTPPWGESGKRRML